jgi:hypothetical protein
MSIQSGNTGTWTQVPYWKSLNSCFLNDFHTFGSIACGTQENPEGGAWKSAVGRVDYLARTVADRYELFIYDNIAADRLKPGER